PGTVTLTTPAGSGQSTTLTSSIYPAGNNLIFYRGTNLGAATGDRTAVVFNTAPTLTNGLVPLAVGAASPTSEPTDFVTTQTINPIPGVNQYSLQLYSGYTNGMPATPSNAATTYFQSGSVAALTSASSLANAIKIGAGGGIDIGVGNTLTL